jgi:hypothetical protein
MRESHYLKFKAGKNGNSENSGDKGKLPMEKY